MTLLLFFLLNATLFIRPAEIVPFFEGLPIYNLLILACLLLSMAKIIERMSVHSLFENPIDACVVGLFAAIPLSNLTHLNLEGASEGGVEFGKVVLYYFLLISILDTPTKLIGFLRWLVGCIIILTTLALLQYHELIDIPALQSIGDGETDPVTGQQFIVLRLCSTGIFHDPNDLCLILLFGMGISLFEMGRQGVGLRRFLWISPLILFGYALTKTHSKGGFLAMLASMGVFSMARFGLKKTVPFGIIVLPVVLFLFAGRQTQISTSEDTGQDRIQLWSAGIDLFRQSPLFGIGQHRYVEEVGLVAHNSFIHGFAELGILGGTLFAGAFYYALATLQKLGPLRLLVADPELSRLQPYLLASVAAYATCLLAISRNYVVPTYLILGLVSVYLRLATHGTSLRLLSVDSELAWRFLGIGGVFLIFAYLFVRTFARFGA